MERYNWEQKKWPNFAYSIDNLEDAFFLFAEETGKVTGVLSALSESVQTETVIDTMVAEAIKTSAIEGEYLSRKDVLSSIRKNLGLVTSPEHIADKRAAGIGELMIDIRRTHAEPLTAEKLFAWHRMLLQGSKGIKIGAWRTHGEPMQVVSGALGKQKVHFEAPPLRSAIAHLYFESVHPFEDGNGRIGRAIAEKALSQGIGRPALLSLSRTIEAKKQDYYDALQKAQSSTDITEWITYFVQTILTAQTEAAGAIDFTLKKTKFFDRFTPALHERQLKVIRRMLDEGPKGFTGGMNAGKYASIAGVSKATATRDLQELLQQGAIILCGDSGGRSTKYQVNL